MEKAKKYIKIPLMAIAAISTGSKMIDENTRASHALDPMGGIHD